MFLIQHTTMNAPYVELGANSKSTSNMKGLVTSWGRVCPRYNLLLLWHLGWHWHVFNLTLHTCRLGPCESKRQSKIELASSLILLVTHTKGYIKSTTPFQLFKILFSVLNVWVQSWKNRFTENLENNFNNKNSSFIQK